MRILLIALLLLTGCVVHVPHQPSDVHLNWLRHVQQKHSALLNLAEKTQERDRAMHEYIIAEQEQAKAYNALRETMR